MSDASDSETDTMGDNEETFEVEEIKGHEPPKNGATMPSRFYIKWKEYPDEDNTWEPLESLSNCDAMLQAYLKKNGFVDDSRKSRSRSVQPRKSATQAARKLEGSFAKPKPPTKSARSSRSAKAPRRPAAAASGSKKRARRRTASTVSSITIEPEPTAEDWEPFAELTPEFDINQFLLPEWNSESISPDSGVGVENAGMQIEEEVPVFSGIVGLLETTYGKYNVVCSESEPEVYTLLPFNALIPMAPNVLDQIPVSVPVSQEPLSTDL